MKKTLKWLAVIAAIGTIIGIIIALLCKNKDDDDTFDFEDEDEDFDLDSDLQPVERGYVPLNKTTPEEDAPKAEASPEPAAKDGADQSPETDTKN